MNVSGISIVMTTEGERRAKSDGEMGHSKGQSLDVKVVVL